MQPSLVSRVQTASTRLIRAAVSLIHTETQQHTEAWSACALALRTSSAAPHAVQPRCLHSLATRERAFESIPSTSSSTAPRSASCGSRKSCSAATTSAPSFSITAGSCTALASLVSQERHQLDQHQERAAQAGAIRALKAPPPSFIMRSTSGVLTRCRSYLGILFKCVQNIID